MKTTIKFLVPATMLLFSFTTFTGCDNPKKADESKEVAEDQNKETFTNDKQQKNDAQFVVDVAAANYYEIGLSKYAAEKTVNKDIKSMASMMFADHTAALNDLKSVASKENISIPNEDTARVNSKIRDWRDKKPADFNKAYIDEMVSEHKSAVSKLEAASNGDVKDSEVINWVNNTLPKIRTHLQKLNDMQSMMK